MTMNQSQRGRVEGGRGGAAAGDDRQSTRTAIVGGVIVLALAVGWFVLSHFVMNTGAGDAVGEALGVAFALLVVASIFGAVGASRRNQG
jgi:hypothetical protein